MRSDGIVSFFFIQHQDSAGDWKTSALEHFLFDGLSYKEKQGEVGERYREAIRTQGSSTPLWQKYDVHGFADVKDAKRVLEMLRERHPKRAFRVVVRTISQVTEVVGG
jgi:hypothetical protein